MNIELGNGQWAISPCNTNGRIGLMLQRSETAHEVGSFGTGGVVTVDPVKDVVIYFNTEASARILQDELNHTILLFLGLLQKYVADSPDFYKRVQS